MQIRSHAHRDIRPLRRARHPSGKSRNFHSPAIRTGALCVVDDFPCPARELACCNAGRTDRSPAFGASPVPGGEAPFLPRDAASMRRGTERGVSQRKESATMGVRPGARRCFAAAKGCQRRDGSGQVDVPRTQATRGQRVAGQELVARWQPMLPRGARRAAKRWRRDYSMRRRATTNRLNAAPGEVGSMPESRCARRIFSGGRPMTPFITSLPTKWLCG